MNLKQLEYFVAIAEERQVTAAARRLHISQPPLSHELAQLEAELGVQLVRREPRGVSYERATTVLALVSAATREVAGAAGSMTGTLCLAVASGASGLVPTRRLGELAAHYPDVSIELRGGTTPQVIDLVERGLAEVGVVRTPFKSEGLRCRFAPVEPLVAIMPAAWEAGEELSVAPAQLAGLPIVCDARLASPVEAGATAQLSCTTDDERTTCAWAAAGMGVGLVPRSMLRVCDTGDCAIKTVSCKELDSRAAVVWKPGRSLSPLAERAIALLGELS
mgnify:CR=1 FL=1